MPLPKFLLRRSPQALPETVDIDGRSVPLLLRRNARAKRLTMRLAPGGTAIAVTAPPRIPVREIVDFVERHRGWAAARLRRTGEGTSVADGAVLPFRGGALRIVHQPGRRASTFEPGEGETRLLVGGEPAHLPRRVADALKREARRDLEAAVARHAGAVGLAPAALALKDTRSRWGSCTADRRLAFSWRIVMAPPEVLDYLAAHEVAHFREMNHGPAFWALCGALCPGMDEGRAWLKRNGAALHAVRFA